jgi:hypothetical protein
MRLGEILLKRELVTDAAISEALERQKTSGGRLGANLIALGYLTEEQLSSVIHGAPAAPNGLSATGISGRNLLSLLLKFMSVEGCETVLDLANRIKLPRLVVQQLFDEATQQKRKNSCRPWALRAALACPFDTPSPRVPTYTERIATCNRSRLSGRDRPSAVQCRIRTPCPSQWRRLSSFRKLCFSPEFGGAAV